LARKYLGGKPLEDRGGEDNIKIDVEINFGVVR
jgi:hypothetical protein